MVDASSPDAAHVAAVRALLPATGAGIYLDTAAAGPLPAESAAAAREAEEWDLRVGRGGPDRAADLELRLDEARAVVAALLQDDPAHVALTRGGSDGIARALGWIGLTSGDQVITSNSEEPSVLAPLVALRDRSGVELVLLELDGEGAEARLRAALTPRTRALVLSHAHPSSGAVRPVRALGEVVRDAGVPGVLEASLTVGAIEIRAGALGMPFISARGEAWMLGPEGTGILWVAPEISRPGPGGTAAVAPPGGRLAFEWLRADGTAHPWPDARRFETDAPGRTQVLQLARGLGWLAMTVGLDWINERGPRLARGLAEDLAKVPGVELVTPLDRMATIVSFRIGGWPAEQAMEELSRRAQAIVGFIPGEELIRASVGAFNTEQELARFSEAVTLLARHTPDTLPPRRSLVVLADRPRPDS